MPFSFWWNNAAAPTLLHSLGFSSGGYLRTTPAKKPTSLPEYQYRRLEVSDIETVTVFLRENYGDTDWYLDAQSSWLLSYFQDPAVIVLGLFRNETLYGTIFSTPLSDGVTYIGSQTYDVRVIECLCIHASLRKQGIAGFMISAMDYETSAIRPIIHLWSRELDALPLLSTHLNAKNYCYLDCSAATERFPAARMDFPDFVSIWEHSYRRLGGIVTSLPSNRRGGLHVWRVNSSVFVVSDTKRRTRKGDLPIWEIVWCGKLGTDFTLSPYAILPVEAESVAFHYFGIFFTMTEFSKLPWTSPWRVGHSGLQAWYIYNFVPPSWGDCELHAIRDEI